MPHNIAIVGAGQAGLQLALGLISNGHRITLVTDRDANSIRNGHIMSSQGMFDTALQFERDIGIDFWQNVAPQNKSVTFTIAVPQTTEIGIRWKGLVNRPFQSVDQRIKFSHWLDELAKRGGKIHIESASIDTLENLTNSHDLTIVATGKGGLSQLFNRDNNRSIHHTPPRVLSCLYVKGMEPISSDPGVRPSLIPGVGEYFTMPGLSLDGPCEMMLFEGIPGGAFDCWNNIQSPEQQLEKAIALLHQYIPWEAARCNQLTLVDNKATLIGSYVPEVREPIHKLKSGKIVLGMADAVVLNDPISGQGSNNASKCAQIYMHNIIENENNAFDEKWMLNTFEKYWEIAQWSTALSNLLLNPPESHVIQLLATASKNPSLANMFANGFEDPSTLFPWITSEKETATIIKQFQAQELELTSA